MMRGVPAHGKTGAPPGTRFSFVPPPSGWDNCRNAVHGGRPGAPAPAGMGHEPEETARMGRLTTHVLDTMAGGPAAGLAIELWTAGRNPRRLAAVVTNADGRSPGPLLEGDSLAAGRYELRFRAGDYLRARHGIDADPLFLDEVPVRFGIADPGQHYHVPLLLSAYGYSTYRGS